VGRAGPVTRATGGSRRTRRRATRRVRTRGRSRHAACFCNRMLPRTRTPLGAPGVSGLRVVIVDNNLARSAGIAALVRRHGCEPAVAADLDLAARMWSVADVVILDDDAFGNAGLALAHRAIRAWPRTYRCIAAGWSRFADVRACADYVFAKPFGAVVLSDAFSAVAALRRGASAAPTAHGLS
jgi:hypothetical protein